MINFESINLNSKNQSKLVKSDGTEIEEYGFHQYKCPISKNNIDINKMVVSNKSPFAKQDLRYFIGYKDNREIRPIKIHFPEMSISERYICIKDYMQIFFYKR